MIPIMGPLIDHQEIDRVMDCLNIGLDILPREIYHGF